MLKKSQSAVEFIFLSSFLFLLIVVFFALTSSKILDAREEANRKIAEDIANFAYREVEIAASANNGYTRLFSMPYTVNGVNYDIEIIDNRELVVRYLDFEYVKFLPSNLTGNLSPGTNEIKKIDGLLFIKNLTECKDTLDNDKDNAVDLSDAGCVDANDNDESNCGDNSCEGTETCLSCVADCGSCSLISLLMKSITSNAIRFDKDGNVLLKGIVQEQVSDPIPTAEDEFIIKDTNGNEVVIINLENGNMFLTGRVFQNQPQLNPSPSQDNFVIKDIDGNVISYFDDNGNFYLKGILIPNGNP